MEPARHTHAHARVFFSGGEGTHTRSRVINEYDERGYVCPKFSKFSRVCALGMPGYIPGYDPG